MSGLRDGRGGFVAAAAALILAAWSGWALVDFVTQTPKAALAATRWAEVPGGVNEGSVHACSVRPLGLAQALPPDFEFAVEVGRAATSSRRRLRVRFAHGATGAERVVVEPLDSLSPSPLAEMAYAERGVTGRSPR